MGPLKQSPEFNLFFNTLVDLFPRKWTWKEPTVGDEEIKKLFLGWRDEDFAPEIPFPTHYAPEESYPYMIFRADSPEKNRKLIERRYGKNCHEKWPTDNKNIRLVGKTPDYFVYRLEFLADYFAAMGVSHSDAVACAFKAVVIVADEITEEEHPTPFSRCKAAEINRILTRRLSPDSGDIWRNHYVEMVDSAPCLVREAANFLPKDAKIWWGLNKCYPVKENVFYRITDIFNLCTGEFKRAIEKAEKEPESFFGENWRSFVVTENNWHETEKIWRNDHDIAQKIRFCFSEFGGGGAVEDPERLAGRAADTLDGEVVRVER